MMSLPVVGCEAEQSTAEHTPGPAEHRATLEHAPEHERDSDDGSGTCSEHAWGAYGDNNPASEDELIFVTIHEMMHVLRLHHVNLCVDTEDDASVMHGYLSRRRSLSRADQKYLRSRYGFNSSKVTYKWDDDFGPAAWFKVTGSPSTTAVSPVVMTVQDDTNRGVGFLTPGRLGLRVGDEDVHLRRQL